MSIQYSDMVNNGVRVDYNNSTWIFIVTIVGLCMVTQIMESCTCEEWNCVWCGSIFEVTSMSFEIGQFGKEDFFYKLIV